MVSARGRRQQVEYARSIRAGRVIDVLARLVSDRGAPRYLRSDNGPEFVSSAILRWTTAEGIETAHIVETDARDDGGQTPSSQSGIPLVDYPVLSLSSAVVSTMRWNSARRSRCFWARCRTTRLLSSSFLM
jgi:hypothetical protein